MQSSNYAAIEVSKNLAGSANKWVPDIIAGGGADGDGSIMNVLIGMMVHDKLKEEAPKSDI